MADDGIKLTDAEREALGGPDGPWIKDDWDDLLAAVESIVAARVQALTAERDELRWERDDVSSDLDDVSRDLIAARAELAAANKAANDLQVVLTHAFEDIANVQAANAALSARLERVQALADAGRHDKRGNTQELVRALDAALGEDT